MEKSLYARVVFTEEEMKERIKNFLRKIKKALIKALESAKSYFAKMNSRNRIIVLVTSSILLITMTTLIVVLATKGNSEVNEVMITFNTVEGNAIEPVLINSEYQLPEPESEGYSFSGWYLSSDYTGDPITSISPQSDNITVYAKWIIIKLDYDMSGAGWDYTEPFVYDGTAKSVAVSGLPDGVTVDEYIGNTATDEGIYTASVTFNYDSVRYNKPFMADLEWEIEILVGTEGLAYTYQANTDSYSVAKGTADEANIVILRLYDDGENGLKPVTWSNVKQVDSICETII